MHSKTNLYDELETLFLDVGNTLISMDLGWMCDELRQRAIACDVEAVRRAEAAARPVISELAGLSRLEQGSSFPFYLRTILARLTTDADLTAERRERVVAELASVLKRHGTIRLWSAVLPGVPQALRELRNHGVRLVAVSNSDGTVRETLGQLGLLGWFDAVVDSTVVGFEKPDPRIFEHALQSSGAERTTTLHVGDLYEIDVLGARAAGIRGALVDPYGDWAHVDCERVVDLSELARRVTGRTGYREG